MEFAPGARVLVRVDYNVPFDRDGAHISDDSRIVESLPTIDYLTQRGCKVILCAHLGRPNGRRTESDSLQPVAERLAKLIGRPAPMASDCIGADAEAAISRMTPGDVILLENLRFHPGEESNDPAFANALANLADCYIGEGFGVAHRSHASTAGVTKYLPSAAGLLMAREIDALGRVVANPKRPCVAVLGGAKAEDKMPVVENLSGITDRFLLGGVVASAFIAASRHRSGEWSRILRSSIEAGSEVRLPLDVVTSSVFAENADAQTVTVESIGQGQHILDIGTQTVDAYIRALADAETVIWNGPMGVFEWESFAAGTSAIAQAIASLENAHTVIGGGSTADAVRSLGIESRFSHVSTGGGATLEFLSGKELPGIAALADA